MRKIKTLGIDLAKNVFQLHGADQKGKKVYGKKVKRKDLFAIVDTLKKDEDFLIAMETCGGSHHIARTFMEKGYQARIIHAKFVKPYVKSNKNDAVDAEAIAEASRRPNMRFAGIKSREQQDIQSIHRVREQFIKRRTATANEMKWRYSHYFPTRYLQLLSSHHGRHRIRPDETQKEKVKKFPQTFLRLL